MNKLENFKMEEGVIYKFRRNEYQTVGRRANGKDVKAWVTYEIEAYREGEEVRHGNGAKGCDFCIVKPEAEFLDEMARCGWRHVN